jgi:hypothetical protein
VAQTAQIEAVGADVWVLTEAHPTVLPPALLTATSEEMPGQPRPAHFAVLGAEDLECVPISGLPTAVAGLVRVAGSPWLVLGICMPWRRGAPPLPPTAAPGATTGPEEWQVVLERLDHACIELRQQFPDVPLVVAGDFNQTLDGYVVGSHAGRAALQKLLDRHQLVAYTARSPSARDGCRSIDHIAGPLPPHPVEHWPSTSEGVGDLSDHCGYVTNVQPAGGSA